MSICTIIYSLVLFLIFLCKYKDKIIRETNCTEHRVAQYRTLYLVVGRYQANQTGFWYMDSLLPFALWNFH